MGGLSPSFEASVHQAPEKWTPTAWRKYVNAISATAPGQYSTSLASITPVDNKDGTTHMSFSISVHLLLYYFIAGTYTVAFTINGVGEYLLVGRVLFCL